MRDPINCIWYNTGPFSFLDAEADFPKSKGPFDAIKKLCFAGGKCIDDNNVVVCISFLLVTTSPHPLAFTTNVACSTMEVWINFARYPKRFISLMKSSGSFESLFENL